MVSGPPRSATRRNFCHYGWALAAVLGGACSVFPDEAVLPVGAQSGTDGVGGDTGSGGAGVAGGSGFPGSGGAQGGGGSGGRADTGGAGGSVPTGGLDGAGMNGGGGESAGAGGVGPSDTGGQGGGASCATPTVLTFDATADTYLDEVKNQQKSNFGSETKLLLDGVADARRRSLVNFDLSTLPEGQTIVRATLRLVLVAPVSGERNLSVYRVGRAWQESEASWVRASTGPPVSWSAPGGDIALLPADSLSLRDAALGAQVDFDMGADLAAMASLPSYGWLLDVAPAEDVVELASRQSLFAEQRPKLLVELCP